jgi:hypothetical protein
MVERRGPVKAAQFQTTADGHATVIAQLPGWDNPRAAIVTVQTDDGAGKPAGAVKLKGAMAASAARPAAKASGKAKTLR